MSENLELEVWQRVAGLAQSPSHDFHHIERVQTYAEQLGRIVGVDTDLVRIAAILHDLGRGDESRRHGLPSIEASKEMAEQVLRHLDLSADARRTIIEAIETHDQPELTPSSPAGRILKDADFLAGFGAWGVLRIAMWSGETGRRVDHVLRAMTEGMQRRLQTLEFSESREVAFREFLVAQQFRAELDRAVDVPSSRYPGFYCVIEGVSGVGKNTVAAKICEGLAAKNLPHRMVEEPSSVFRKLRDVLEDKSMRFVPLRRAVLVADRADQCSRVIEPALKAGEVVISVRSYLSTAVYQAADVAESYRILIEHDWMPRADLLLLLDTDAPTALERIASRNKPAGDFETPDQLAMHRTAYLQLSKAFPARGCSVIDASRPMADVASEALSLVMRRLGTEAGDA